MPTLPPIAHELLMRFSLVFREPTFQRMVAFLIGAILSPRKRTVTSILWGVRGLVKGHWSDYHRLFSRARWSSWSVGRILAAAVLSLVPASDTVKVALDDTTTQRRGDQVYGKGCHYDALRSTRKVPLLRFGHRWVVLAVLVKLPAIRREWALPVLVALYRPAETNRSEGRRHKSPIELARALMATLLHWFPERRFYFLGDGGYASHELARFCARTRGGRATLISRFYPKARLYALPPAKPKGRRGRARLKGARQPSPQQVVASTRQPRRVEVRWYQGQARQVALVSEASHWYVCGGGLLALRWVAVRDPQSRKADWQYFYATDAALSPEQIVGLYVGRWSVETTFQEARAHLGLETVRQWGRRSVERATPLLLGLFSLVALLYERLLAQEPPRPAARPWYRKAEPTFSDALEAVRHLFWKESILTGCPDYENLQKMPPELLTLVLERLSQAA